MLDELRNWWSDVRALWNRFWFTPRNPATLCLLRILVGGMLFYTHLVWTLELSTFFSSDGVFAESWREDFTGGSPWAWSHFAWSNSAIWLWGTHIAGLVVLAMFALGLWTRVTGIISFLLVVSYANRAGGALFGLDQINGFMALYLAIAPCGVMYSLDSWLANRKSENRTDHKSADLVQAPRLTMATISTRLVQLHLCVVYLFAGLGKLQGVTWWEGTAIWGAFASYEYQTLDMTWMVHLPWLVNLVTLVSVFWELSYPFLVWPRLSRPIYLGLAVMVHLGIGLCMGMITFAFIMICANMSFVSPERIQRWVGWCTRFLQRNESSATANG